MERQIELTCQGLFSRIAGPLKGLTALTRINQVSQDEKNISTQRFEAQA